MYVVVSMKAVLFLTMEEYKMVLSKNKIALWKIYFNQRLNGWTRVASCNTIEEGKRIAEEIEI